MQQKSNHWSDIYIQKISPIMHWISDIVFYFCTLLILWTIQLKFSEYLDWNSFQTSNSTFVESEIKIPFLQFNTYFKRCFSLFKIYDQIRNRLRFIREITFTVNTIKIIWTQTYTKRWQVTRTIIFRVRWRCSALEMLCFIKIISLSQFPVNLGINCGLTAVTDIWGKRSEFANWWQLLFNLERHKTFHEMMDSFNKNRSAPKVTRILTTAQREVRLGNRVSNHRKRPTLRRVIISGCLLPSASGQIGSLYGENKRSNFPLFHLSSTSLAEETFRLIWRSASGVAAEQGTMHFWAERLRSLAQDL